MVLSMLISKVNGKDKVFDVVATTASQVYSGLNAEVNTSTQAVDLTKGQVMTEEGFDYRKILTHYYKDIDIVMLRSQ